MQADPGSSGNLVLRQAPGGGTEHTIQVDQDGQIVGKDKNMLHFPNFWQCIFAYIFR